MLANVFCCKLNLEKEKKKAFGFQSLASPMKRTQFSYFILLLAPFELIDENSDGNITRDEWQMKIELAMGKVMHITNVTLDKDNENLYDDIWEALDCNNATAIDMEDWEMLLDGENQCGDKLDSWFHFAFNTVVSVIQIVCQKY